MHEKRNAPKRGDFAKQYFDLILRKPELSAEPAIQFWFFVVRKGKNRPAAKNFQSLKISGPFGTASCWDVPAPNPARNECDKSEFT